MTLFTSEVQTLAGVPAAPVVAEALISLVRPLVGDSLEIDDGPVLDPELYEQQITSLVASRPQFSARGKRRAELTMRWIDVVGTGVSMTGHLRTYTSCDPAQADPLLDALVATAQVVGAPFSWLDRFDAGFRDRLELHRVAYQADKTGADRVFGLLRGFTGVPWRTVLGPVSVSFFGEASLATLPDTLATKLADGYWLLTPCENVDDWTPGHHCDGEREIIEALGTDRFFNPETGSLPAVVPILPELSAVAATARRRDADGEWQWESFG